MVNATPSPKRCWIHTLDTACKNCRITVMYPICGSTSITQTCYIWWSYVHTHASARVHVWRGIVHLHGNCIVKLFTNYYLKLITQHYISNTIHSASHTCLPPLMISLGATESYYKTGHKIISLFFTLSFLFWEFLPNPLNFPLLS